MISWFQKAKAPKPHAAAVPKASGGDKENASIQGSYTDFAESPLKIRHQLSPMSLEEAKAFDWVMDKMAEQEGIEDHADLVQAGLDSGWLYIGKQGELRVSEEAPE